MGGFRTSEAAPPVAADVNPGGFPLLVVPPTETRTGARRNRPSIMSAAFHPAASVLLGAALLVEAARIHIEHRPDDRRPPDGVMTRNRYSDHYQAARALSERWGRIRTRDPRGRVVLFPGFLARLYWPPGKDRKDRLSLDDLRRLAVHLRGRPGDLRPDAVVFDAVVCTPDGESQARIRERNRRILSGLTMMPPPAVHVERRRIPITVGALRKPVGQPATTPAEVALLCIVNACHLSPPGDPPGMVGYAIREAEAYDPALPYEIAFGMLPPGPDDPSPWPASPRDAAGTYSGAVSDRGKGEARSRETEDESGP